MQKTAYFVFVLVGLLICVVKGHVIGIDFGSEFIKVAAPHDDNTIDIVLNELSKRKTDNYIGFRNDERYIGDQAKALAARFPMKTACAVNQLIGLRKDDTSGSVENYKSMQYEFATDFTPRNTVVIPFDDAQGSFSSEELYAMIISYTKEISIKDGVVDPNGVVITIPFHTSSSERRAILDATQLAGVNVLGFMHSTTAAAFYYGMRHRGFGDRVVNLVVFDIGTTHTEAGVYTFSPSAKKGRLSEAFGTLTTVTVLEDRSLGGRAFDLCVAKVIEKEAIANIGIKPVLGGKSPAQLKSQFSLMRAANKVREVLSVNSNTPYTVEGIAPDRDYHSSFSRATFEKECAPLFARMKELARQIIPASGKKAADIKAFELMGGAARTPKIFADISSVLGRDADRTLNMDEAAAVGAAYYAVKLSPFYSSKSFRLVERVPYHLSFTVDPAASKELSPTRRTLVNEESTIDVSASITLNRTDDFSLKFYEALDAAEPFAELQVSTVRAVLERMSLFSPAVTHANNSHIIRIQLRVNETGLLQVDDAVAVVRYAANVSKRTNVNVTDADGNVTLESRLVYYVKMRHRSMPLKTSWMWLRPRQFTKEELEGSHERIARLGVRERMRHDRAIAKNNLEGYIFWLKSDGVLENAEVMSKLSSSAVEEILTTVQTAQEWLEDGEGSEDSCTREAYEDYLTRLKQLSSKLVLSHESPSPASEADGKRNETAGSAGDDHDDDEGDL